MANSKKGTAQVNPPTPKQRVEKQFGSKSALVDKILALYDAPEGSRSKLMQSGFEVMATDGPALDRWVRQEYERWGRFVRDNKVQLED